MNLKNTFPGGSISHEDRSWHEHLFIVSFVGGERVIGILPNGGDSDRMHCVLSLTAPQMRHTAEGLIMNPPLLLPYDGIHAPTLELSRAQVAYLITVSDMDDKAAEYFIAQYLSIFAPPKIVVPKTGPSLVKL